MEKSKIIHQQNNQGFTLIELIVTMLVSTMVMGSVVLFISVAMNQYRNTGDELNLQMESQIAMNLVGDIIIETQNAVSTTEFSFVEADGAVHTYKVINMLARSTAEDSTENLMYNNLIVLDNYNRRLLFYKVQQIDELTGTNLENVIRTKVTGADNLQKVFLADYATDLSVTTTKNLVTLAITFENNGHVYQATSSIYIRNTLPTATPVPSEP